MTTQLRTDDVSEIDSYPRAAARVVPALGLLEGWNMTIATVDEHGRQRGVLQATRAIQSMAEGTQR